MDGFGGESSIHDAEVRSGSEGVAVRAWLDSATYRYFQRLLLTVELRVEPGLHVYGSPIPEGFIPLSVEIDAEFAQGNGVIVGEPSLPEPHPFRLEGLDEQFFVYEDSVRVTLPLTFSKRDAGDLALPVTVRYQACSATDCLMPATVALELPVRAEAMIS